MQGLVYLLCAGTALACSFLLLRSFRQNRMRLLLWCSLCFLGLAVDNVFLFIDIVLFPDIDLSVYPNLTALLGACLLLYGLIWDSK
jgi:hypothetical protein